jgi:hypothetical protein
VRSRQVLGQEDPVADNRLSGRLSGNFYKGERVLDDDAFYVRVLDDNDFNVLVQ